MRLTYVIDYYNLPEASLKVAAAPAGVALSMPLSPGYGRAGAPVMAIGPYLTNLESFAVHTTPIVVHEVRKAWSLCAHACFEKISRPPPYADDSLGPRAAGLRRVSRPLRVPIEESLVSVACCCTFGPGGRRRGRGGAAQAAAGS